MGSEGRDLEPDCCGTELLTAGLGGSPRAPVFALLSGKCAVVLCRLCTRQPWVNLIGGTGRPKSGEVSSRGTHAALRSRVWWKISLATSLGWVHLSHRKPLHLSCFLPHPVFPSDLGYPCATLLHHSELPEARDAGFYWSLHSVWHRARHISVYSW